MQRSSGEICGKQFGNPYSILTIAIHGEHGDTAYHESEVSVKSAIFPCLDSGMFLWLRGRTGFSNALSS